MEQAGLVVVCRAKRLGVAVCCRWPGTCFDWFSGAQPADPTSNIAGKKDVMHYKIRKLKTVGLRQGAPTVSPGWSPMALRKTAIAMAVLAVDWFRDHLRRSWIVVRDRLAQLA